MVIGGFLVDQYNYDNIDGNIDPYMVRIPLIGTC